MKKGYELRDELGEEFAKTGLASLPIRVMLKSGDIVEIEGVKLSPLNGGEFHILAGPTEDEEFDSDESYEGDDDNPVAEVDF